MSKKEIGLGGGEPISIYNTSYLDWSKLKKKKSQRQRVVKIPKLQVSSDLGISVQDLRELRSLNKPPPAVKSVLTATLLLLGHYEGNLKWENCVKLIKNIAEESKNYDYSKTHPAVAARVEEILLTECESVDKTIKISLAAAGLHHWCLTNIELIKSNCKEEEFKPANLKQQKQIGLL